MKKRKKSAADKRRAAMKQAALVLLCCFVMTLLPQPAELYGDSASPILTGIALTDGQGRNLQEVDAIDPAERFSITLAYQIPLAETTDEAAQNGQPLNGIQDAESPAAPDCGEPFLPENAADESANETKTENNSASGTEPEQPPAETEADSQTPQPEAATDTVEEGLYQGQPLSPQALSGPLMKQEDSNSAVPQARITVGMPYSFSIDSAIDLTAAEQALTIETNGVTLAQVTLDAALHTGSLIFTEEALHYPGHTGTFTFTNCTFDQSALHLSAANPQLMRFSLPRLADSGQRNLTFGLDNSSQTLPLNFALPKVGETAPLPKGLLTDVTVTYNDKSNQPHPVEDATVPTDATLNVVYTYQLPTGEDAHFQRNQPYSFEIPAIFNVNDTIKEDIKAGQDVYGHFTVSYDASERKNTATITFNEKAQAGSSGTFGFSAGVDEDSLAGGGKKEIRFSLGGTAQSDPVTIIFDAVQPKAEVTIEKQAAEGQLDLAHQLITWQVTVTPKLSLDKSFTQLVIEDVIDTTGTLYGGGQHTYYGAKPEDDDSAPEPVLSLTCGGEPVESPTIAYDETSHTLTCTVDAPQKDGVYVLTYQTHFDLEQFNNNTLDFKNKAAAKYTWPKYTLDEHGNLIEDTAAKNSGSAESAVVSAAVAAPSLDKTGALRKGAVDVIDWTIDVSPGGFTGQEAVITDTLPKGLTLVEGSVKQDGVELNGVTATTNTDETSTLTITIKSLNKQTKITYSTKINGNGEALDPAQEFQNQVSFAGGPGKGFSYTKTAQVNVGTSLFGKSGTFDKKTHTITWTLKFNSTQSDLPGYTVTDVIPDGLTLVTDDNKQPIIQGISNNLDNNESSYAYKTEDNKEMLIFSIGASDDQAYTVTYQTILNDDQNIYWATNLDNAVTPYTNTAVVKIGELPDYQITAKPPVSSKVIAKEAAGFDAAEKTADWKIVINQNEMTMKQVVVQDIPSADLGQTYLADSVKVTKTMDEKTAYDGQYTVEPVGNGVKITFEEIQETLTIHLKTRFTDLDSLYSNDVVKVRNRATLTSAETPADQPIEDEDEQQVSLSVVKKSGVDTKNNKVRWTVIVNENLLNLPQPVLTDNLIEALVLDPDSVKLYRLKIVNDKAVTQNLSGATLITGDELKVLLKTSYDPISRQCVFAFQQDIADAYALVFTTDVIAGKNVSITNSIQMDGIKVEQEDAAAAIAFKWNNSFGNINNTFGSLLIEKRDSSAPDKVLAGAAFTLQKQNSQVSYTGVTDDAGQVAFAKLRPGIYTLTETQAPEGYYLDRTEPITIQIVNAETNKITLDGEMVEMASDKPLVLTNPLIKGGIKVTKVAAGSDKPLAGAVFVLYQAQYPQNAVPSWSQWGEPVTTGEEGVVQWLELPYGHYYIAEETAPKGYYQSTEPYQFEIAENGQQLTYTWPNTKKHTGGGGGGIIGGNPGEEENTLVPAPPVPEKPLEPLVPPVPPVPPVSTPQEQPLVPSTEGPIDPGTMDKVIEVIVPPDTPLAGQVDVPEGGQAELNRPPVHGTADVQSDGHWQYMPEQGFNGQDQFVILVTDAEGNEEFILMDMEVPLAGMLPETGEANRLPIYLAGALCLLLGVGLWLSGRPRRAEKE